MIRGEPAALRGRSSRRDSPSARARDGALVPEPEIVAGTKSSNVGRRRRGERVSVHVTVPLFDRGAA